MEQINKLSINLFNNFSNDDWSEILNYFDATINYTSWFLSYIEVLNSKSRIQNYSFVLNKNDIPIAIVPLYIENIEESWQISMGQEPIYAPIFSYDILSEDIFKYYEYIMVEIEKIAKKYKCVLARFHYSPLLYSKKSQNYYKEFGYRNEIIYPDWYIFKSNHSYIIDLNKSNEVLTKNIRSRYRTNINRTSRLVNLIILDKFYFEKKLFNKYVDLYYQVKGLKRTIEAFRFDEFAVKNGFQSILLCEYKDMLIGAVALHTHKKKARYNSSIQLYNVDKGIYPNHFLLKSSIDYLKRDDFELFEIGEQVSPSELYKISKKEENLSHFKSGWGGHLIPWIKVQKEFNYV
jgi:hypothetical protein